MSTTATPGFQDSAVQHSAVPHSAAGPAFPTASGNPLSPFVVTVRQLVTGPAVTLPAGSTIRQAAECMTEAGVGSLVVMEGKGPVGIVTKSDMARRVVAAGKAPGRKVDTVMTRALVSIDGARPLFDGLLLMIQHGIGHLVVTEKGRLAGVVSEGDWLALQESHPAATLRHLDRAETARELARLRRTANELVRKFSGEEGSAQSLTEMVTEINDRVSRRVIELVLREKGGPPAPFAWISMGSEGRREQTLSTDQDNGLVFADLPAAKTRAAQKWFLEFAGQVVEGLEICGFPRCKGNTMASNPELCLPLRKWRELFSGLIGNSRLEDLLKASIYFDFRCLYGDQTLVDGMWADLLARMKDNRGFLRFMAARAEFFGTSPVHSLAWRWRRVFGLTPPPLDIKKQALGPLVRSARALALACGSSETHTLTRLQVALREGLLPEPLARATESAYDFVMLLRIRQHFAQQARGEPPTNRIVFSARNRLEGRFLEESLRTIAELEDFVWGHFGELTL